MPYNSTLLYTVRYHTKNTLKQFAWVNKKKKGWGDTKKQNEKWYESVQMRLKKNE